MSEGLRTAWLATRTYGRTRKASNHGGSWVLSQLVKMMGWKCVLVGCVNSASWSSVLESSTSSGVRGVGGFFSSCGGHEVGCRLRSSMSSAGVSTVSARNILLLGKIEAERGVSHGSNPEPCKS